MFEPNGYADKVRMLRIVLLASKTPAREIAQRVGCSKATLSNVALGLYEPNDELRERLADELGVPAPILFRRVVDEFPWMVGP